MLFLAVDVDEDSSKLVGCGNAFSLFLLSLAPHKVQGLLHWIQVLEVLPY